MPATRRRRIVRRAVIVCAGVVLLLAWYVAAWFAVGHAESKRLVRRTFVERIRPVFVPLVAYCESEFPGSEAIERMWWKANPPVLITASNLQPGPGVMVIWSPIMPPIPPEE